MIVSLLQLFCWLFNKRNRIYVNDDEVDFAIHRDTDKSNISNSTVTRCISCDGPHLQVKSIVDKEVERLKDQQYPYENLIFEGGGNKGIAYCGALKVLDQVGILKTINRYAGASAGAGIAMLAALGYSPDTMIDMLVKDINPTNFNDSRFGKVSLVYNLIMHHGWHPGKKFEKILRGYCEEATGNPDITFMQLYEEFGKELCVVCTNITTMSAEYFHPKTTPDVGVALAVRMSMSLPGVFQPVQLTTHGTTYCYIDGGLLCNYPIHCFDGWFLSMEPENSFLKRLDTKLRRQYSTNQTFLFNKNNSKTLGMMLYSGSECEFMRTHFEERLLTANRKTHPIRPDTKLSRKNGPAVDSFVEKERRRMKIFDAAVHFWQALRNCDKDGNSKIDRDELRQALTNGIFTEDDSHLLFGDDITVDKIFKELDTNNDGEITYQEFMTFIEKKSVAFLCYLQKLSMRDVNTFGEFLNSILDTLIVNVKQIYMKTNDADRTIGINTDYIQTTDFDMEEEDKSFLIEQGKFAALQFLREYACMQEEPSSPDIQGSPTFQLNNSSHIVDH